MHQKFTSISLICLATLACNKDIEKILDFEYEERNIYIAPVFFYSGAVARADTLFATSYNTYLQIESANLIFSNFFVSTDRDTFYTDSLLRKQSIFSLTFQGKVPAGYVRSGTYRGGGYGCQFGLDSAVNFGTRPADYPPSHPLANTAIWEKDAGYDLLQIKGVVIDSAAADSTQIVKPFMIRVRNLLNFEPIPQFQLKNFNIDNQRTATFECYIGLEAVLNLYNLHQTPIIGGNPFNLSSQDSMKTILENILIDFQ